MAGQDREPVTLDRERAGRLSRVNGTQMQGTARPRPQRRRTERAAIDERIIAGEFGYCLKGGDEIAEPRLRYIPSVATCMSCAGNGWGDD